MNRSRRSLLILPLLWSVAAIQAHAQCDPVNAIESCSANELVRTLGDRSRAEMTAAAETAAKQTADNVVNTNRATSAPDPFAADLHATYQDFLVPLSFAVSSIEESKDGRALIVRLNPFREPPFVGGFTVTASKPDLDPRIAAAIPEDDRDAEVKRLEEDSDELGDLTFSGSVAAETVECTEGKGRCWGRNPRTYRQVLSSVLLALAPQASSDAADAASTNLGKLLAQSGNTFDTKLSEVPSAQRGAVVDAARQLVAADLHDRETYLKLLDDLGIEHLTTLIDNQPQFSLTATWHERDDVAGPTQGAATLELQFGRHNLNRLKHDCKTTLTQCIGESLRAIDAGNSDVTDKFVLSASFKETDRYQLTADNLSIPGFAAIDAPRTRELSAKLQWGQRLKARVADQQARFDISAEGVRLTANGVKEKNDWVGTATLTVPVASNISIPLSLKYGNRPDLLTGVRDSWGAHFGISYRLPWELTGQ
jgi:hypothetical protein